ncbi:MAG: RecQ family ATP-dependent DNA helicase [Treponema sp.]|nr:RecQ family ATP-dependent DNA helicase [Treponema sp.]
MENVDENIQTEDDEVLKLTQENFGIKYLYPWQRMVISNILEAYNYQKIYDQSSEKEKIELDKENKDSFCKGRQIILLPTGAGKSLCFQVPALVFNSPTLVIYPLLALMTDQQRRMEEGSLGCVLFRGGQTKEIRNENFEKLKNGAKIIIANPEILQNKSLLNKLKEFNIVHLAIDEAHCVSEWGDSFRPAYLTLSNVIKELNPPVISAFTATASPSVLSRISEILFNGEAHVVRSESDRQNIHYFVKRAAVKKKEALFLSKTEKKPMIIFCGTRNNAEDMCRELNLFYGKNISQFYHAGLERDEKESVEKWFYNSKDGILCATCAYGMGVDKKDIKTVIHIEPSETAEAYIQEAGRGGRDGSIAKAILIWSIEDSLKYADFPENSRQAAMKQFAETNDCRRQVLLDSLGAEKAVCSGCDLCNKKEIMTQINNLPFFKKKIALLHQKENKTKTDYEVAFNIIRRNKNLYSKDEAGEILYSKMNDYFLKQTGIKFWNHMDNQTVFEQLKKAGFIKEQGLLWKGKLIALKKQINP